MSAKASTTANGGAQSLAAKLEAQHDAHKTTVEDVVDEEDLKHLPPSAAVNDSKPGPVLEATIPEEPASSAPAPKSTPKKSPAFDVQSEELFPALGSGPKPAAPAAATWGAKKPSAAAAVTNGQNSKPLGKIEVTKVVIYEK